MASAVLRKSVADLWRHKARSLFAAATLALAVGSIGIFALPAIADRAMRAEVSAGHLADVTVRTRPLPLTDVHLAELARLPNVVGVEPRSEFFTRVYVGELRADVLIVGVRDFARQKADVVRLESGTAPGAGSVLTEAQNSNVDRYEGGPGDVLRVITSLGGERRLRVTGVGRNLELGQELVFEDWLVLYATPATVASLSGKAGYRSLAFRLRDASPAAVAATLEAVRDYLRGSTAFTDFTALPSVRERGSWPGEHELESFSELISIIAILALVSAFALVSSTMTTLVGEQGPEIATMKAIGARRRQIAALYVRTALLLGALGTVIGVLLGVVLANVLAGFFLSSFFAVDPGFGVDLPVLLASVALGLAGPPVAALPAIRRAVRGSIREALQATGSTTGSQGRLDVALREIRFLPRSAQIGLRGIGRRKRRSLSTVVQVTLAVATLLAMAGLAAGVTATVRSGWSTHGWQLWLSASLEDPLDVKADRLIRRTPGVADAEPIVVADAELAGKEAAIWATGATTLLRYRLTEGRWYSARDDRVAVVERNLARVTSVEVGDTIRLMMAAKPVVLRVIGIAANQQEDGTVVYVPLTTARSLFRIGDVATGYWVTTTSAEHALIDRTATRLEDTLTAAGYHVGTEITYVAERDEEATNRTLTTTITVLGFVIVAISMIGLANAITMNVLERTREIGILRCIGARGRDVRRIFAAEGLALVLAGWLLAIPLGYALERLLVWLIRRELEVVVLVSFPPWNIVLALGGTIALALVVMLLPLRRAVRLRPGETLRYA